MSPSNGAWRSFLSISHKQSIRITATPKPSMAQLPVNLRQTGQQSFPGVGIFGNTPAQVTLNEVQLTLFTPLTQHRNDDPDEVLTLAVHVSEGAADEQPHSTPTCTLQRPNK